MIRKYTPRQLSFLDWAYARGVACKGEKMSAREAERAMLMVGTDFGRAEYGCSRQQGCSCPTLIITSDTSYDHRECIWRAVTAFRAPELLEHWTFRQWFSGQTSQIKAKLQKVVQANTSTTVEDLNSSGGQDDGDGDDADC